MVNGAYHGPGILERGDRAALHTRTTAMHRSKAAAMASLNIFFFESQEWTTQSERCVFKYRATNGGVIDDYGLTK